MYSSSLLLFFPLFFLQLDDLKAGSSTSPNLEGTSVAPAGHRDGKEKLSQLIQVLRIDKQFDNWELISQPILCKESDMGDGFIDSPCENCRLTSS